jgi:hypothetical protein
MRGVTLREDAQKLKEEKATLEGMVESHDELIMEIAKETGLDRTGEDAEDDEGGDATTPPVPAPPVAALEEVVEEEDPVEMVLHQEAPMAYEVILVDVEPEMPQCCLYHELMRDYEENPPRMMDDMDDLHDLNEGRPDMDEWFPEDRSNDQD